MPEHLGQNWLLLRGLTREAAHWGGFIGQLQAAFPDARINTLDLPGTGQFAQQPGPASMDELLAETRQRALDCGLLKSPLTLLGLSLGGMLVWHWLSRYPQDAAGGALINSSFARLSPFYRRLQWQNYPQLLRLATAASPLSQETAIVDLVSNLAPEQRRVAAQQWADIRQLRPLSYLTAYRQLQAAARFDPGLVAPSRPVLIINSLGDRLVAPVCSQAISGFYNLPLRTHPSAGHDLPLDDAAWLCGTLSDWIIEQIS